MYSSKIQKSSFLYFFSHKQLVLVAAPVFTGAYFLYNSKIFFSWATFLHTFASISIKTQTDLETILQSKEIDTLIKEAMNGQRAAQYRLFQNFAPKMLSVCRYYIADLQYAEDVMITGFYKAFKHLNTFRFEGSFEGWIRRIITREAISFLKTNKSVLFVEKDEITDATEDTNEHNLVAYDIDKLQELIDKLPEGYKTVFLLYVIEDYSHKEIAALLNISESTSKSQLFKAKKMLKNKVENLKMINHETR